MPLSELGQRICLHLRGKKFLLKNPVVQHDADVEAAVKETVEKSNELEELLRALGVKDARGALELIAELRSIQRTVDKLGNELHERMGSDDGQRTTSLTAPKVIEVRPEDAGANDVERLLSAALRTEPSFRSKSRLDQMDHIYALRRSEGVVITGLSGGAQMSSERAPAPTMASSEAPPEKVIEVRPEDKGFNAAMRICSALARTDPTFASRSWPNQLEQVHAVRHDPTVEIRGL